MNALESAFSSKNLSLVWRFEKQRLRRSTYGIDRQTGANFEANLPFEFSRLRQTARAGRKPSGLLAIAKPKPEGGNRIICVPTIADRLFQFALLAECRPDLDRRGLLNSVSYGLSRGSNRSVHDARRAAIAMRSRHRWVLKADIQKFFDNIPRGGVRQVAERLIQKRSLQDPILTFLDTEIEDGFDPNWAEIVADAGIQPGKGVRQGMPLSPYYAGMILLALDKEIARRGLNAIRYVDDIIGFFDTKEECESFAHFLQDHLGKLGLSIGVVGGEKSKTRIYEPLEPASFLGMELAWRVGSGFQLRISQKCIEKIGAKFAEAGVIENLLARDVTLPKLGKLLDEMERGYLQAYEAAENHGELVREVRRMKSTALECALEETFGEDIYRLDKKRRRFLGIDDMVRHRRAAPRRTQT
jgi:hypothetical protein